MRLLNALFFDQVLSSVVVMLLSILLIGLLIKKLHQPYVVAYIIAGVLLGPYCLKVFKNPDVVSGIGQLGLIIQMFFIGTKMEIHNIGSQIRRPLVAVIAQLMLSFLLIVLTGHFNNWSFKEILIFTCIISLSSSAIIFEYLDRNNELKDDLGMLTSSVLVLQDVLFVPMLTLVNILGRKQRSLTEILVLAGATFILTMLLRSIHSRKMLHFSLPFKVERDHEAQVFIGLLLCFGFAWLTQLINLSASLGALVGGIFVSRINGFHWLEKNLVPFRVFFLSFFFLAIGLQVNVPFFKDNLLLIILLTAGILIINSAVNALVFRMLKVSWRDSIYAGALLSQVGEFSVVLCIVGKSLHIVNEFWYQLTLAVISLTMFFTAGWINVIRLFIFKQPDHLMSMKNY